MQYKNKIWLAASTKNMPKPFHPRKALSTVAQYSSAPGATYGARAKPTAAWKAEQKQIKSKYAAEMKAYWVALKAWNASNKSLHP